MEIKTQDFYHDVKNSLIDKFDTSDYPKKCLWCAFGKQKRFEQIKRRTQRSNYGRVVRFKIKTLCLQNI
jgi:hypothetical protein